MIWKGTLPKNYDQSVELMKFLLLPFVCFWAFGFPDKGGYVETLSGFAPPAFFVLSGYCILQQDEKIRSGRIKRAAIRSAMFFSQLLVVYVAYNLWSPMSRETISFGMFKSVRLWFNFLFLSLWPLPIGNSIWFVQSLLYALIILLIANKLKLLRFYKPVLLVLVIIMLFTGEFAGLIGFDVLGYDFIPGGALNRALPYLLLGMLIREKKDALHRIPAWTYLMFFAVGGAMAIGEVKLLSHTGNLVYEGHMIGYGIMAFAVCGLAVVWDKMKPNRFSVHGSRYAKRVYALHNPLFYLILEGVIRNMPEHVNIYLKYGGPIVLLVCLVICLLITMIKKLAMRM